MSSRRGKRICEPVNEIALVLSFFVQLIVVPAVILWIADLASVNLKSLLQPWRYLDEPVRYLAIVMPDFVGFLVGFLASRAPGSVREPARWLWVVPALLCAGLLATSTFYSLDRLLVALLGVRGNDYTGTGIVGLVFPLGGVCLYSFGVRSGDRYTDPLAGAEKNYDGPQAY